jgi:DNA-binding transcriptional LysR family regulator
MAGAIYKEPITFGALIFSFPPADPIRIAAKKDLGLVMLPEYIVARDIEKGHLRVVLQDYACEPMEIHAVYPHRKYVSAKVRTFLVFLVFCGYTNRISRISLHTSRN